MKKTQLFLLALASGLLLSLAWPARGFPFLLLLSFVPLFFIADAVYKDKQRFHAFHLLFFIYPAFFVFNLLTTWWIYNSTPFGAIMAVLLNSLFMSLPFLFYHWTRLRFPAAGRAFLLLVFFWLSFEHLHQRWDLTWTWLNLGGGFAAYPSTIQWYEFTGVAGGTLWILLSNILAYQAIRAWVEKARKSLKINYLASFAGIVLLPLILSWVLFYSYTEKSDPVEVVIVQPNIDPYNEQYSLPPEVVMDRMFTLARPLLTDSSRLLVCPESAIQEDIWENGDLFNLSPSILSIKAFIEERPRLGVVMGASTYKRYEEGEAITETARYSKMNKFYYDAHNTAAYLDSSNKHQLYHKSKLVVGVERMPFPRYLKFLENYALDLGGTIGSLGISEERTVFSAADTTIRLGTAICYESVYGEFFGDFVKNGANLMLIITNDGWWGNSPGHRQHLLFASLRAIESRRSIARSANTGISCFVDQRGLIHQPSKYWEPAAIRGMINKNDTLGFYTRHGDYLGRAASWISLALLLVTIFHEFFRGSRPRRKRPAL